MLDVTLEIPLSTLALSRHVERDHAHHPRVRSFDDALDRAALPGSVAALEQHAHLDALVAHPLLQLHELTLERNQLAPVHARR